MAYLKPSATTKIFNNLANSLAMRSTMWDVHTLEVARRNAGEPQRVPVIPLEHDGSLFIVSTRGESDWVKNVRAAGIVQLGQKGKFETYAATEVPADERSDIITAYRKKNRKARIKEFTERIREPDPAYKYDPGIVLNGRAISLPRPEYPVEARRARAQGVVVIKVKIDELGKVLEASDMCGGDPLLVGTSLESARKARFSPTKLSGQPVKVSGVITYNFVAR